MSRDRRRQKELQILQDNPGKTLVVTTVIMPGSVKRSSDSLVVAYAALQAIEQNFGREAQLIEMLDLQTGFESYHLLNINPDEAKRTASQIEDSHPLGRMMDIDVYDSEGNAVSRADREVPTRRCLLCDNDARICMRAFTHTQAELLGEIHRRVHNWLTSKGMDSFEAERYFQLHGPQHPNPG